MEVGFTLEAEHITYLWKERVMVLGWANIQVILCDRGAINDINHINTRPNSLHVIAEVYICSMEI